MEIHPKDLPKSADVVVIGSGFTGLSAARTLAKAGTQVVVLEKEEIGAGASSRNGGIVHPTLGVSGQELIDRYGVECARDLYQIIIDGMEFKERPVKVYRERALSWRLARSPGGNFAPCQVSSWTGRISPSGRR